MADRDGARATLPLIAPGLLMGYRPGDSLAGATATRASVAAYHQGLTYGGELSDVMARFVPGESLAAATATRASTARFNGSG